MAKNWHAEKNPNSWGELIGGGKLSPPKPILGVYE
jgi:hypothetical protein